MDYVYDSTRKRWGWVLVTALALSAACGDDDAFVRAEGETERDASAGDGGASAAPVHAVVTQVFGADGAENLSYVLLTESFASGGELDLEDAVVELTGRTIGAGPGEGGALFLAGEGAPVVTRYELQEDGALEEGETVSFSNQGLGAIGEYGGQFQFVSETRAYFFDGSTAQVVIWNPRDMTVEDAVELPELVMQNAIVTFGGAPVRIGDKIIAFAGLRSGPAVPSLVGVVSVDTSDDSVSVITDDRCGYVRDGVLADDGMVYLATEAYGAAVHRLNPDNAAAPCMLRYDPEQEQFDPDFHLDLTTLADGAAVGSLIEGPGGGAFLMVLDEELFPIADDTHPRVLASAAAWKWAAVGLGDEPSLEVLEAEATGGSILTAALGELIVAPLFTGREGTTFVRLTEEGPGDKLVSVPGLAFSAVRLRSEQ